MLVGRSLFLGVVVWIGAGGGARADCPDRSISCAYGAVGHQGTCWETRRLRCRDCGPRHCPTVPTMVPVNYSYACAPIVLADKEQIDGCSNPLTDPLSELYKGLFRPACVQHDLCYHNTIGIKKESCDQDFKRNMTALCRAYYTGTVNAAALGSCLAAVNTWYGVVSATPLARTLWDSDHAWMNQRCPGGQPPR